MFRARTDLPLGRDATTRFLPWIIALMVYLAALALAGTMALNDLVARWDEGLADTVTVRLPAGRPGQAAQPDDRMETVLQMLRDSPGIVSAEPIDRAEVAGLLESWLGPGELAAELPLPELIDVRSEAGARVDYDALTDRLAEAAPGTVIENHALWRSRLLDLAVAIKLITLLVVFLIAAAAVLIVAFATRAGLAAHRPTIELLHMIGAQDNYVARQFQSHMVRRGLTGGIAGLALALASLFGLARAAAGIERELLPDMAFSAVDWLTLAGLPLVAAIIAMITARVTVLRVLRHMI